MFVNVSNIFCADATTSLSNQFNLPSSTAMFCISAAVSPTVQPVDFITAFNCAVALAASVASFTTHWKKDSIPAPANILHTFVKALLIEEPRALNLACNLDTLVSHVLLRLLSCLFASVNQL